MGREETMKKDCTNWLSVKQTGYLVQTLRVATTIICILPTPTDPEEKSDISEDRDRRASSYAGVNGCSKTTALNETRCGPFVHYVWCLAFFIFFSTVRCSSKGHLQRSGGEFTRSDETCRRHHCRNTKTGNWPSDTRLVHSTIEE